jgi:hypothetical protein
MGMPEGTIKARLARGRELLRKRFPQLREHWSNGTNSPPPETSRLKSASKKGGQQ